jgi:four helix bundle protein
MATIKRFEDLEIWQIARQLCKEIFDLTFHEKFIKDFSLKDQIRRSISNMMSYLSHTSYKGQKYKDDNFIYEPE